MLWYFRPLTLKYIQLYLKLHFVQPGKLMRQQTKPIKQYNATSDRSNVHLLEYCTSVLDLSVSSLYSFTLLLHHICLTALVTRHFYRLQFYSYFMCFTLNKLFKNQLGLAGGCFRSCRHTVEVERPDK